MKQIINLLGKIMEVSALITMKEEYKVSVKWAGYVHELTVIVKTKDKTNVILAVAELYVHSPEDMHWSGDPTEKLERLLLALQHIQINHTIPDLPGFVDHGGYSASVVNLIAEREEVEA